MIILCNTKYSKVTVYERTKLYKWHYEEDHSQLGDSYIQIEDDIDDRTRWVPVSYKNIAVASCDSEKIEDEIHIQEDEKLYVLLWCREGYNDLTNDSHTTLIVENEKTGEKTYIVINGEPYVLDGPFDVVETSYEYLTPEMFDKYDAIVGHN